MKNIETFYPLSPMQHGMLFHTLYAPEAAEYYKRLICVLEGDLNVEAFQSAWQRVVDCHSALRTSFLWEDVPTPVQVVHRSVQVAWEVADLRSLDDEQQKNKLERLWRIDQDKSFVLSRAPLTRFTLVRIGNNRYEFGWSFHHLILDGWSMALVFRQAMAGYGALCRGEIVPAEKTRPYRDYINWLQKQPTEKAEQFWREYFRGSESPTPLSIERGSAVEGIRNHRHVAAVLPSALVSRLRSFAREQRVTVNSVLQGAWAILMSRYSGQNNVLFGTTVAGRPTCLSGVESMVGLFINTLPVRVDVGRKTQLGTWLRGLQSQHAELRQYEHTRLADIQKWSGISGGQQLFNSLFVFENYPAADLAEERAGLRVWPKDSFERTSFSLTALVAVGRELNVSLLYDANRFGSDAIESMARHYRTVLENIPALADSPLRAVPLLTAAETREMVVKWNDTATDWKTTDLIPQMIERQAARTPNLPAIRFGDVQLTYAELDQRSNQLANYLRARGAGRGTLVGVYMERSIEMVLALVAVVKVGAAYVPLDPEYPSERLRFMIADAETPFLLTQRHLHDRLPNNGAQIIILDGPWEEIACQSSEPPGVEISPDNLVYVIYTSGSTGPPKGAMNTHGGLVNRLLWMQREYGLNCEDRVMQKTPFSFDVSVWEFFWPLMTGASIIVAGPRGHRDPSYLVELIAKEKVTTLHFVPSMLHAFLQEADLRPCHSLKRVICSGEALSSDLQEEFFSRLDCELHNLYGPTEASIDVTYWKCERGGSGGSVPIGRPIANTQIYILDRDMNPVPVGVPGELHIGGIGLAHGYWRRPELTKEKFIPDPFSPVAGTRLYKSGDLARYRADGVIEYLGRMDHQVKIRGQRVELGEIEDTLKGYSGVSENVVIVREDTPGDKRLVAYLVAKAKADVSISELRSFLKERLPEHMVPSAFVLLDALPLSPNGKLDRRALPAPEALRPELENRYVEPRTAEEMVLARIWADVLKVDKIGVQDNFFELGGHSLLALQILSRVREVFEVELPLRLLFEAPTIGQLKETILRLDRTPGRVEKIAQVFLAVSCMSEEEVSAVLQRESSAAD